MSFFPPGRAAVFLLTACSFLAAQQPETAILLPDAQTHYRSREVATTMHWQGAEWLIRATREREERASLMLQKLGLKPGQTVCDLGCGNGYHSLVMARQVAPGGRVLGVDIQPEMLQMLRQRAKNAGLENIEPVLGERHDPHLAPDSCDLILLVDVYHEVSHPVHLLRFMRQALKPDGRIALVEFRAEDDSVPIKPLHKMSRAQILAEYLPNGFELAEEINDLPWQHLMFFKRAPLPAEKSGGASFAFTFQRTQPSEWKIRDDLVVRLEPVADEGFAVRALNPQKPENDGVFPVNPPYRGNVNESMVLGWYFRNTDNTGPNAPGDKNVNAPVQFVRSIPFLADDAHRTQARAAVDTLSRGSATEQNEARRLLHQMPKGRIDLILSEITLGNLVPGQKARIESAKGWIDITLP